MDANTRKQWLSLPEWFGSNEMIVVGVGAIVLLAVLIALAYHQQQSNIDLCVRAFDYTREQCEFIVKARVKP